MPKNEIDYSNTIIYKITCKDTNIKDVYVGHTTNFVQRKHAHKQTCVNNKASNYKCKLYEVIRDNGGWQNWIMEIINFCNCKDHYEARKKEQEYFISLGATLNSIEPLPKPKVIIPKDKVIEPIKEETYLCDFKCSNSNELETHNVSDNHILNEQINTTIVHKKPKMYECEKCSYLSSNKKDYSRHILTAKHLNQCEMVSKKTPKPSDRSHVCKCGKGYTHLSGLLRHKKKCIEPNTNTNTNTMQQVSDEIKTLKNVVIQLVKSNDEITKHIVELCNKTNTNISN